MTPRRSAAEIIAFHFSTDIESVREARYQSTRYTAPAVYTLGERYLCSPTARQKLPKDFAWTKIGEHYGRGVYAAETEEE